MIVHVHYMYMYKIQAVVEHLAEEGYYDNYCENLQFTQCTLYFILNIML